MTHFAIKHSTNKGTISQGRKKLKKLSELQIVPMVSGNIDPHDAK
jgi:hypothetical protein